MDPDKLPWGAIQTTLCKGIFGGRITKDVDQDVLDQLVSSLFVPSCFDVNFKLVDEEQGISLPDITTKDKCFAWIEELDDYTPPKWIGWNCRNCSFRSNCEVCADENWQS